eukprot:scaffold37061_cov22-Tisochrysis_lutea.AAC.2
MIDTAVYANNKAVDKDVKSWTMVDEAIKSYGCQCVGRSAVKTHVTAPGAAFAHNKNEAKSMQLAQSLVAKVHTCRAMQALAWKDEGFHDRGSVLAQVRTPASALKIRALPRNACMQL